MKEKGYVHLYTGNGKGKTTAALGLALRAVGAGMKVYIAQFVKGMSYAELEAIERFPEITLKQYGLDCFIKNKPSEKDIKAAQKGLREISGEMAKNKYNMLILDEIHIALFYNLVSLESIQTLIKSKPLEMELVLTGRYAPKELYDYADLITEMKEVKHYYKQGIQARKGIEF